ncbi:MAG TPA: hypothetical protein VFQ43_14640, partial [Nitrososphaera sp.]|nr:hypothetical protein [Nitrososphaera sp.]
METHRTVNPLLEAVRSWGKRILEQSRAEIGQFYLPESDGSTVVGYIWTRTLSCQNPECGAKIPLLRQLWLAKKETKAGDKRGNLDKNAALRLIPDKARKQVDFEVVWGEKIDFDAEEGTVSRAHVRCPVCGNTIDDHTTRRLFREGASGQRMAAVVLYHPDRHGKTYRIPRASDLELYHAAEVALEQKRQELWPDWGLDPIPDERIPLMSGVFNVPLYGIGRWGDLFNARQLLNLITFAEKVRQAHKEMLLNGEDEEFAKAVATYLALGVD